MTTPLPCLQAAAAPAPSSACIPAYQAQILPAVRNSTQFYNVFITLPDCFYGLVSLSATGRSALTEDAGSMVTGFSVGRADHVQLKCLPQIGTEMALHALCL